jgi:hypothetical protein
MTFIEVYLPNVSDVHSRDGLTRRTRQTPSTIDVIKKAVSKPLRVIALRERIAEREKSKQAMVGRALRGNALDRVLTDTLSDGTLLTSRLSREYVTDQYGNVRISTSSIDPSSGEVHIHYNSPSTGERTGMSVQESGIIFIDSDNRKAKTPSPNEAQLSEAAGLSEALLPAA